jgi:hypothetical protein
MWNMDLAKEMARYAASIRIRAAVFLTCLFTDFTLLLPVEEGTAAEAALDVLGMPRFVKTDGGPEFGGAFVVCNVHARVWRAACALHTVQQADGRARVGRKIGEVNAVVWRLVMHARPSSSPSVAVIVRQAQWALNAVPLPKVMTRYTAPSRG